MPTYQLNNLNSWKEASGRIRAVAFYCQRCKKVHFEIITPEMAKRSEDNLQCYAPPKGWTEHKYGLFCDKCTQEYIEFMRRGGTE